MCDVRSNVVKGMVSRKATFEQLAQTFFFIFS